jgi:hypothetical protein
MEEPDLKPRCGGKIRFPAPKNMENNVKPIMMERRLSLTVFTPAALTKMKGKCCYHHTPDSSDSAIILTSQTRKGGTLL